MGSSSCAARFYLAAHMKLPGVYGAYAGIIGPRDRRRHPPGLSVTLASLTLLGLIGRACST
jgi:hypothetical protein